MIIKRESGSSDFPIWLLGDSNPTQWQDQLKIPLGPRHPIRHNIWTPILDHIQDKVFREKRIRLDTSQIYVRNALDDAQLKPSRNLKEWSDAVMKEAARFASLLQINRPVLLFCFGAFSYEFARRAISGNQEHNFGFWGAKNLGADFKVRIATFNPEAINAIPLIHRSISGGRFVQSHDYFVGKRGENYFEYVGNAVSELLLRPQTNLDVWI